MPQNIGKKERVELAFLKDLGGVLVARRVEHVGNLSVRVPPHTKVVRTRSRFHIGDETHLSLHDAVTNTKGLRNTLGSLTYEWHLSIGLPIALSKGPSALG